MLNTIQVSTQDNKLNLDTTSLVSSNYMGKVLECLKQSNTKFNEIRQIIADANVKDFEEFIDTYMIILINLLKVKKVW